MADYQNIFTQVQVRGHTDYGIPQDGAAEPRYNLTTTSHLLGRIGDAQLGPLYLGWSGVASLICGFIAIEIIGLNMWASVGWDPIRFFGQLPWLSLDQPLPEHGLKLFMPLNEGGWWLMAGFFLTASILLWWVRSYRRAITL
ncbi:MAG: photosynthetic reaction center subunit M, partial [Hyphomonas sp.]